jgi:hypothetical protein
MKKLFFFFSLLTVLFLFACSWQAPSEIQIKGSPSLKFSLDMDFSEMFKEMMNDAFLTTDNKVVIQNCVNAPEFMTFLIHVDLCKDQTIDLSGIPDIGNPSGIVNIPVDRKLFDSNTKLPVNNFNNNLKGFKFDTDNIKSNLFVDGSRIVEKLGINISLDSVSSTINGFTEQRTSGVDLKSKIYNGREIPAGGENFSDIVKPALEKHEEMEINLSVVLKSGAIDVTYLRDPEIKVELVIWLPLVFKAEDKAEIKLPGFDGMGNFLNSLTESGMIEYLKLNIGLNVNPFREGKFVIQNPVNEYKIIELSMSANAIGFELTEEKVKYFDNTFTPDFKISFAENARLGIPKALKIMNVSMDAKINHTIEL